MFSGVESLNQNVAPKRTSVFFIECIAHSTVNIHNYDFNTKC